MLIVTYNVLLSFGLILELIEVYYLMLIFLRPMLGGEEELVQGAAGIQLALDEF